MMMTLYSIKVVVFKESSFRKYLVLIKLEKTKLHLQSLFFCTQQEEHEYVSTSSKQD